MEIDTASSIGFPDESGGQSNQQSHFKMLANIVEVSLNCVWKNKTIL